MGIVVGTSSWADPGFVEKWYPTGLPARDRLGWYAERFEGVEVNSTFYAIPGRATVERWVAVTPAGFTFDVKLHRLLSRHAAPLESLPPGLRDAGHLRAWLYRITTTTAIDHHRARRREVAMDDVPVGTVDPEYDDGGFDALIAPLPDGTRAALHLRFVEDLDYDAIALRLDCSPAAARQRVSTALRTLRQRLTA